MATREIVSSEGRVSDCSLSAELPCCGAAGVPWPGQEQLHGEGRVLRAQQGGGAQVVQAAGERGREGEHLKAGRMELGDGGGGSGSGRQQEGQEEGVKRFWRKTAHPAPRLPVSPPAPQIRSLPFAQTPAEVADCIFDASRTKQNEVVVGLPFAAADMAFRLTGANVSAFPFL